MLIHNKNKIIKGSGNKGEGARLCSCPSSWLRGRGQAGPCALGDERMPAQMVSMGGLQLP